MKNPKNLWQITCQKSIWLEETCKIQQSHSLEFVFLPSFCTWNVEAWYFSNLHSGSIVWVFWVIKDVPWCLSDLRLLRRQNSPININLKKIYQNWINWTYSLILHFIIYFSCKMVIGNSAACQPHGKNTCKTCSIEILIYSILSFFVTDVYSK